MSFDRKYYLDVKAKLDNVSPSFCLAKWMHVTLHLHNGQTHSCYHCPQHDIPQDLLKQNPSVLHNTPFKAERRKEMLDGKRHTECNFCWNIEDLGGISDRLNMSSSDWTSEGFEKIDKQDSNQKIAPTYVEVSFSNTCNFKCSYCSPSASSRWYKEIKEEGAYDVREPAFSYLPRQFAEEENPYIEAWWKWLPEIYSGLKYLRLTGGEPLMSENTFRLMDFMMERPSAGIDFAVNSNMGLPEKVIDRFVLKTRPIIEQKKLRKFTVFTSIDTWGNQAEYTRNGLDINLFKRNVDLYLSSSPDVYLSFMITFQVLSLPSFNLLLEYILDLKKRYNKHGVNRIEYSIDKLVRPSHQALPVLPADYNHFMESILNFMRQRIGDGLYDLDPRQLDRFETVYSWMKKNQEIGEVLSDRADFYKFFSRHDKLRGTNFLQTFPEFKGFWQSCESEAKKS
jgi:organic radical activating enzyme